ncbi:MAG: alpha-ketoacid dehydrogenase subunit beta, partial [Planctomycetes bacterium]|nr:alpha-ketoacid dehydrogenase subunit beta [Planctomycetota bacterium]
ALGAALTGMRPVAEIQYSDFLLCGMDQLINQIAKIRLMTGGQAKVPLVIRAPIGTPRGGTQHCQSLEAWFMHSPGLKVVIPSSAYDAKGLLKSAIRDDNPVLFLEHSALYGSKSIGSSVDEKPKNAPAFGSSVPEEEYLLPLGKAEVKKEGKDITIVATMQMVQIILGLADELEAEGISIELVDPRSLVPLDKETILNSVKKTHRLVIVTEECLTCGTGAEIAAIVCDEAFDYLDAPIKRVGSLNFPTPLASIAAAYVRPDKNKISQVIKEAVR